MITLHFEPSITTAEGDLAVLGSHLQYLATTRVASGSFQ